MKDHPSSISIILSNIAKLRDGSPEKLGNNYGRMVSKPGLPVTTLIVPLLEELFKFVSYQNDEQAKADMAALQAFVQRVKPTIEE